MSNKGNPKKKLANKMLTQKERQKGITPFDSMGWYGRQSARAEKELIRRNKNV